MYDNEFETKGNKQFCQRKNGSEAVLMGKFSAENLRWSCSVSEKKKRTSSRKLLKIEG